MFQYLGRESDSYGNGGCFVTEGKYRSAAIHFASVRVAARKFHKNLFIFIPNERVVTRGSGGRVWVLFLFVVVFVVVVVH